MQVRDILFVDDLVDAFLLAQANIARISGNAFNIGGGVNNVISLLDLLDMIEQLTGERPQIRTGAWRPGDQRYYVSDIGKMNSSTGWAPRVGVQQGVKMLHDWLRENVAVPKRMRAVRQHPGLDSWSSNGKRRSRPARSRTSNKEVA